MILPCHRVDRSYETNNPLVNLARDSFKVISIRLGGNTLQESNYRHTIKSALSWVSNTISSGMSESRTSNSPRSCRQCLVSSVVPANDCFCMTDSSPLLLVAKWAIETWRLIRTAAETRVWTLNVTGESASESSIELPEPKGWISQSRNRSSNQ